MATSITTTPTVRPRLSDNQLKWILGYRGTKANYPEPYCSASDVDFPRSRKIRLFSVGSEAPQERIVGISAAKALQAIWENKHFFGVVGDCLCIEYHSPNTIESKHYKLIIYNFIDRTLLGGKGVKDADGITNIITPMKFQEQSGTALYLAIMLGEILRNEITPGDESPSVLTCTNALKNLYLNGFEPGKEFDKEYIQDILDVFSLVPAALKAITTAGDGEGWVYRALAGTDDTEQFPLLSMEQCTEYGKCTPLTSFLSIPASSVSPQFFTGGLVTDGRDTTSAAKPKDGKSVSLHELQKELKLALHPLSAQEQAMIPTIGDNYIISDELVAAARCIKDDWHIPSLDLAPNYLLEGDSGSGKTAATKFWANVFGIPRTKMTMQPAMESANLIGAFYPVFSDIKDWKITEKEQQVIKTVQSVVEKTEMTGTPKSTDIATTVRRAFSESTVREAIACAYDIPTPAEALYDPEGSWHRLGYEGVSPDAEEVQLAVTQKFEDTTYRLLNILLEQAENGAVSYRFIFSELLRAFEHGWLVEIQEAASVLRPGVLTELNSLLEPNGRIELPNGKFVYRHPDTIVVITTNRGYAGNMDLNESLRDRCMFGLKMDIPPAAVMAQRAMAQTGFTDYKKAVDAATIIEDLSKEAKNRNIKGSYGLRSLTAWMLDLARGDFSEDAFKRRVLYKMTTQEDDIALLLEAYRNSPFASRIKRTV